jgi:hypothetical protein
LLARRRNNPPSLDLLRLAFNGERAATSLFGLQTLRDIPADALVLTNHVVAICIGESEVGSADVGEDALDHNDVWQEVLLNLPGQVAIAGLGVPSSRHAVVVVDLEEDGGGKARPHVVRVERRDGDFRSRHGKGPAVRAHGLAPICVLLLVDFVLLDFVGQKASRGQLGSGQNCGEGKGVASHGCQY